MSKLLAHFKAMQDKMRDYVDPEGYTSLDGASAAQDDTHSQNMLFAHDMVYMLDGPEQREAQDGADFDFIAEAECTLSNQYHGHKVTMAGARQILDNFIQAGQELDALKKALFYGRGDDIGLTNSIGIEDMTAAPYKIANAGRAPLGHPIGSGKATDVEVADAAVILHALIGIATEATEGVEALYKSLFANCELDKYNVLEESGDAFWYHGVLFKRLGSDFATEQRRNIAKLRHRFPNKFTEYDANNRDLAGERRVLEADPTIARAEAALEAAAHPLGTVGTNHLQPVGQEHRKD